MDGNRKVILHIICDSIMFDKLYPAFESMEGYENRYLFKSIQADIYQFKNLKDSHKIICAQSWEEWGAIVGDPKNDIIYFHGLWKDSLRAIDYIRKDAIVMWFCFGQEIYGNEYGWAPLLPVKVYKPRTFMYVIKHSKSVRSFLSKSLTWMFPHLYDALQSVRYAVARKRKLHKEMLSRIDYAFTPLPIELDELKRRHPFIKAKPYCLRKPGPLMPFTFQGKKGHILFDHSSMSNNNHLDLLARMNKLHLDGRSIYMPLSYGNNELADYLIKNVSFEGAETHFLKEILPQTEYMGLLANCSHALFGTIRQSGLGTINILLRRGVKIFFFEDSIMYKHLKQEGYYVFSIETDLDDESISTPMTYEMALHNYNLFYQKRGELRDTFQQQLDRILASV